MHARARRLRPIRAGALRRGQRCGAAVDGLKFTVFRPAWLTTAPAKRNYGFCFDTASMNDGDFPLRDAKTTISREDVAEEMLRVATLPDHERAGWFGRGVYLVDRK